MITRRQLMQRGTSAVMAFTLLSNVPEALARQTGSSSSVLPRSPMGEEIWTLVIDSPVWSFQHGGDDATATGSNQRLVVSSNYMANLDMDQVTVLWEAPTPFTVDATEGGRYLASRPDTMHCVLYGPGRAAVVDAMSGDVVFEVPVYGEGSGITLPSDGKPYVRESTAASDGYRLWGYDEASNEPFWTLDDVMTHSRYRATLVAVTPDTVSSMSIETGETLWSTNVPDVNDIIFPGGTLLATSAAEITAIDAETGDMLWIAPVPDRSDIRSMDDYGLLTITQNRLVLIDQATGLETWSMSFDSTPSLMDTIDRSALITDGWSLKLVDLESGRITWESAYDSELDVSYISDFRWRIRTGSGRTSLAVLATDKARIIWEWESENWWSARWTSEHIVLLRNRSEIACFSVETGRQLWTAPFDMWGEIEYAINEGMLGIIVDYGTCTVFDLETGQEVRTITSPLRDATATMQWGYVVHRGPDRAYVTSLSIGRPIGPLSFDDPTSISIDSTFIATDRVVSLLGDDRRPVAGTIPIGPGALIRRTGDGGWRIQDTSYLYLYDSGGDERWRIPLDAPISSIDTIQDTSVLLVQFEAHSWLVDASEGRILWEFPASVGSGYLNVCQLTEDRLLFITDRRASIFQAPRTTVVSRDIALRGAPSENAVERAQLTAGTVIIPTGNTREANGTTWLEVRVDDVTGWLPNDAVTATSTTPSATPLASPVASPVATPGASPEATPNGD